MQGEIFGMVKGFRCLAALEGFSVYVLAVVFSISTAEALQFLFSDDDRRW
jgi:hypothetical protein